MKSLLLTIGAVTLTAMTINATASDALVSPRASGNQIKQVSGLSNDPNLVTLDKYTLALPPRAAGNQIAHVAGTSTDVNPAIACAKNMNGTPKTVAECTSHTTMPNCQPATVAVSR